MTHCEELTLGDKIRKTRKEVNLTQEAAGKLIGKSKYTIQCIERNKTRNKRTIEQLVGALFMFLYEDLEKNDELPAIIYNGEED